MAVTEIEQDLDIAIKALYRARRAIRAQDETRAYPGSRADFPLGEEAGYLDADIAALRGRQNARRRDSR